MDFTVLLDAPDQPTGRLQIAKLGEFKDTQRYGEFSITAANVANWQKNLSKLPGGKALIDLDHKSERKPRDTRAAGWITDIELDGDRVMADVDWTSLGKESIQDGVYQFFSPAYGEYTDEQGTTYDDTLVSGALTNKPFIGSMPSLMLASEERYQQALDEDPAARFYQHALDGDLGENVGALVTLDVGAAERKLALKEGNALPDGSYPIRNTAQLHAAAILAASGHGDAAGAKKLIRRRAKDLGVALNTLPGFGGESPGSSDSRRQMETELLIKTLELPEDTADEKVLEAIKTLATKAAESDENPEVKTLDQLLKEESKVAIDGPRLVQLEADAKAGREAATALAEQRFDSAFEKAVANGRAVPAQEEQLKKFYSLDVEGTLKMLDEGPQIVNVRPSGWSNGHVTLEEAPEGVHPESHSIDAKVRAKLTELGKPLSEYPVVLEQMMEAGV